MTQRDYRLIMAAIDNCENREKQTCEDFCKLRPEGRNRFEEHRDIFLFATMMLRFEIERMIKNDEERLKA